VDDGGAVGDDRGSNAGSMGIGGRAVSRSMIEDK
jgi:hypothetical protein